MIILNRKISENISVAVWQIEETEEYLFNSLHLLKEDEFRIRGIKLYQVRQQKLACRAALAKLLGTSKIDITYSEHGQPQMKDRNLSFSHTKNAVAVAVSNSPVGIDIEKITPRILPLYPKFMSQKEINTCNVINLNDLYYFWCAKEAMYKWYSQGNLDFIDDLKVKKNQKKGIIQNTHTLQLTEIQIENMILVACHSPLNN